MRCVLALVAVVLCSATLQADKVSDLEAQLAAAEKGRIIKKQSAAKKEHERNGRIKLTFNSKEAKAATIKDLKRSLKIAKEKAAMLPWPAKQGDSGALAHPQWGRCSVYAVMDDGEAIIKQTKYRRLYNGTRPAGYERAGTRYFWAHVNTEGLVDGAEWDHPGRWVVTGTTKYDLTDGSQKTVFVIEREELQEPERDDQ